MSLRTYQRKRHFDRTSEPRGKAVSGRNGRDDKSLSFVVQKHAASRLHYDFRLELDGVLKSWAVPKGPSLDPADKRLAVEVEDHPLEYGTFEGTIPQGEYGGGTVMVWDRGTWSPKGKGDVAAALRKGKIEFELHGEKLNGKWVLVRMGGRGKAEKPQWLLRKVEDRHARPISEYNLVEELPLSTKTGRSLDEIASANEMLGGKKATKRATKRGRAPTPASKNATQSKRQSSSKSRYTPSEVSIAGATPADMPDEIAPELATLVDRAPVADEWLHEVKFDGYRMLAFVRDESVRLISRNGKDWTAKFGGVATAVGELGLQTAVLDGEVVAVDAAGRTSFQMLHGAIKGSESGGSLAYFVFDLLYLNGSDLREAKLVDRRAALQNILESQATARDNSVLRFSDAISGQGRDVLHHACKLMLEGIVSKRKDSVYSSGRGMDWVKSKCTNRQELVIGGFTSPRGERTGFGALLLGYFRKADFVYAGKVGTGFDEKMLAALLKRLKKIEVKSPAFIDPPRGVEARGAHWVRPQIVCEVEFFEWTKDGRLRHPAFIELREDKNASEVLREQRKPVAAARSSRRHSRVADSTPTYTRAEPEPRTVLGVEITHPDREVFSDVGATKAQVAEYYERVSRWMMPHVLGRPLSVVRCPQGQGSQCFYQKNWERGETIGSHVRKIMLSSAAIDCLVPDDPSSLVWLVQRGVLEVHTWGCAEAELERPDRMVFDLDPSPELAWPTVVQAALRTRDALAKRGLKSLVKTTGGKGLHVVVFLRPSASWDEVKRFSKSVADELVAAHPDEYIATMSKAKRVGRVFIDYLRNNRGATFVAPFSTRARPGAPVSMPVAWDSLNSLASGSQFTIQNAAEHLKSGGDAWRGWNKLQKPLPKD